MKSSFLVLGGCRSGKSKYAMHLAVQTGLNKIFLATSLVWDQEMEKRVAKHKEQRGGGWTTIEEPYYLPQKIEEVNQPGRILLIDCLTMWVNNMLMQKWTEENISDQFDHLVKVTSSLEASSIWVSNEVGTGIVPENKLVRQFRDLVGYLNQMMARITENVYWMVAGLPVEIKK